MQSSKRVGLFVLVSLGHVQPIMEYTVPVWDSHQQVLSASHKRVQSAESCQAIVFVAKPVKLEHI